MSSDHHPHAEPQQLAFLDAPGQPARLRIAVMGVMRKGAELRRSTDGRCHLHLELLQPGALPLLAELHAPAQGDPLDAEFTRMALLLHERGEPVLVRGEGLAIVDRQGAPALHLQHVASVSRIGFAEVDAGAAIPPHHHLEPDHAATL